MVEETYEPQMEAEGLLETKLGYLYANLFWIFFNSSFLTAFTTELFNISNNTLYYLISTEY